jgi:hypothetical protein
MARQTAQELVEQYQATYQSGRANQNTEIPLALESMNQYWDSAANQKQLRYSEGLRAQTRGHEKDLLAMQNRSAEAKAGMQAAAQKYGARQSAEASKFGAQQSAGASRFGSEIQYKIAQLGDKTDRYKADRSFDLGKYQADTSLKSTRLQTDADKYGARLGLQGQLAGFASAEKQTGMQQQGENFRSILRERAETQREGMRLKTAERGQTFDLFRGLSGSPNRFAHLTSGNMRYWG